MKTLVKELEKIYDYKKRSPSQSKLTPIKYDMELTHLSSEASKFIHHKILNL